MNWGEREREREREREFEGGMENSEGNCFVFVNIVNWF